MTSEPASQGNEDFDTLAAREVRAKLREAGIKGSVSVDANERKTIRVISH